MARITLIGLSGGIGGGKSTVAGMFARLGACVMDADRIAHAALEQPRIIKEVIKNFNCNGLLDENRRLSRKTLAGLVFKDRKNLLKLNRIVHPFVLKTINKTIRNLNNSRNPSVAVIDAPLLFETGLDRLCDILVFVDTPPEKRLKRIKTERKWDNKQIVMREKHQFSVGYKKRHSQIIIDNSGALPKTFQQVKNIFNFISHTL